MALDPDGAAERRTRAEADRDVRIRPDADGMCSLWGALTCAGGQAVEQRLQNMAIGVCGSDPRTLAQRRADALTALALGWITWRAAASTPDAPAPPRPRRNPKS